MQVTVKFRFSTEYRRQAVVDNGVDPGMTGQLVLNLDTKEARQNWVDAFSLGTTGWLTVGDNNSITDQVPGILPPGGNIRKPVTGMPAQIDKAMTEADALALLALASRLVREQQAAADLVEAERKAENARMLAIFKPLAEAIRAASTWDDFNAITIPDEAMNWVSPGRETLGELARKTKSWLEHRDAQATREAAKSVAEAERAEWISKHGSGHLRRAFDEGYEIQRIYAIERTRKEAPGWVVDIQDTSRYDDRSNPSEAELDAADEAANMLGRPVKVVWLKIPPQETPDEEYEDAYFESCPALLVEKWLGKYDLIKIL